MDKEVLKQQSQEGRKAELDKLVETWQERGLDRDLAQRVAVTLTEKDVVRAHARVRACDFFSSSSKPVACAAANVHPDRGEEIMLCTQPGSWSLGTILKSCR